MAASFRTDVATSTTTDGTKTATITTVAGDLLIALISHTGNLASHAVTDDQGGVWVQVKAGIGAAVADSYSVWIRTKLVTTGASTIVTTTPGTTTGGTINLMAVAGMLRENVAAVRQVAFQETQVAGTPAPVFARAPLTDNMVVGFVINLTNPATITERANFTERRDNGYATPASGSEVITRNSGETSTTQTWGGASASAFSAVVIELDASPADIYYQPVPIMPHPPKRQLFGPPVLVRQPQPAESTLLLDSTATATAAVSAAIDVVKTLDGAPSATASVASTITVTKTLDASATGTGAVSSTIAKVSTLQGAPSATAAASTTLDKTSTLAAAPSATAAVSAVVTGITELAAAATATAAASSTILKTALLDAAPVGTAAGTSTVGKTSTLQATPTATATPSAAILVATGTSLDAAITATATAVATLGVFRDTDNIPLETETAITRSGEFLIDPPLSVRYTDKSGRTALNPRRK